MPARPTTPEVRFERKMADVNADIGEAKRERFLAAVKDGYRVDDARIAADMRTDAAYRYHRKHHPRWAARVDAAFAMRKVLDRAGMDPIETPTSFAEFVMKWFPDRRPHMSHQIQIAEILAGLRPREVCMVLLWPECLGIDTSIPTPTGTARIGDLQPGDVVFAEDGTPTHVTWISGPQERECYRVTFSDQSSVVASADHEWVVQSRTPRRRRWVQTTAQLAASVTHAEQGRRRPNHAVPIAEPLDLPPADLALDPYLLGLWLGDGSAATSEITVAYDETVILDAFTDRGYELGASVRAVGCNRYYIKGLRPTLRKIGVLANKHIPIEYLRGSVAQRQALLQGLCDTDGCWSSHFVELTSSNPLLAADIGRLLHGLGLTFGRWDQHRTVKLPQGATHIRSRFSFNPPFPTFRLQRKAEMQIVNSRPTRWRVIAAVEPCPPEPVCCIRVEHPSHTYVFGDQMLVTHNSGKTSTLEDYICRKLSFDKGHRFRYVSEAQDLAKRVIGTVQRRFTDTSEYGPFITRYGPFYEKGQERQGRPWTTEQITISTNPGTERDRNLVASSWTSAVYGSRIDTLVLDDLCSQRNYAQSEEIFRRIRGTFFNRGIELRTLIIGTRIGPGDFYERMEDAGLVTRKIVLPAADHEGNPTVVEWWDRPIFHDGGPCCMGFRIETCPRDGSKLSPREFMELMRHQSGEETWWSSYQQNPRSDERSTFAAFIDRCLDRDREYGALVPSARH